MNLFCLEIIDLQKNWVKARLGYLRVNDCPVGIENWPRMGKKSRINNKKNVGYIFSSMKPLWGPFIIPSIDLRGKANQYLTLPDIK